VQSVRSERWIFSTLHTPKDGDHPVSGHREFGFFRTKEGWTMFFIRGADRATAFHHEMDNFIDLVFGAADNIWKSYQQKLVKFITHHGGAASIRVVAHQRTLGTDSDSNEAMVGRRAATRAGMNLKPFTRRNLLRASPIPRATKRRIMSSSRQRFTLRQTRRRRARRRAQRSWCSAGAVGARPGTKRRALGARGDRGGVICDV
jgi:hypothetical protein